MSVDITEYMIATPLPVSDKNPVALELLGKLALADCSGVVKVLDDGSVEFHAPTKGAASKSTHRTRTEWKEAEYWHIPGFDHWSRQEMTLVKVNSAQKVVVAQVHVKNATTPPLKVFWNKGKLTLGFRSNFDTAEIENMTVLTDVPLGVRFKIAIHVTAAGSVTVTALCNGRKSDPIALKLDKSWFDQALQFHGGIYNQIDFSDATPDDDGSICVISALSTTHD